MRKELILLLLLPLVLIVLISHSFGSSIKEGKELAIGKEFSLFSDILRENRSIQVYLPDGYEESKESYPVLYMLDGDIHFHHVSGIIAFLSGYTHMPKMILVAIVNIDRERDFLPTRVDNWPPVAASDRFHAFLKKELIPGIEKKYRTRPYRILCGHSFGGTFCIHSFLKDPELFKVYIAVSPMLDWDKKMILKKGAQVLQKTVYNKKFLFFTTSADDEGSIPSTRKLASLLNKNNPPGLTWRFDFMEKDDHLTVVHPTIYNALLWLHEGWRIPERKLEVVSLAEVKHHYDKLSLRYGSNVPVPEGVLFNLGYSLFDKGKKKAAIEAFTYTIQLYPSLPSAFLGLGDIYFESGELQKAEKYLKKACQYAEKQKENMVLSVAKGLLKQVKEKLKGK